MNDIMNSKNDKINIILRYMVSPIKIEDNKDKVRIDLAQTYLEGQAFNQNSLIKDQS